MQLFIEILLILITLVIGVVVGWMGHDAAKKTILEASSGQRSKLFELASKDMMTVSDIYLLRAAVRFTKNDETQEIYSFGFMTNQIIDFCEELIGIYDKNTKGKKEEIEIVNPIDREIIRTYARYLLEDQEEGLNVKKYIFKKDYLNKEIEIGSETVDIIKLLNEQKIDNQLYKNQKPEIVEKKNNDGTDETDLVIIESKSEELGGPKPQPSKNFWYSTTGIVTTLSLISGGAYLVKRMFTRKKEETEPEAETETEI